MKKNIGITALIAFCAIVTVEAAATDKKAPEQSSASQKSFCWKISTPNSSMFLLGSVHLGTPDMLKMAKPVEDAFDTSQYLIVEVDVLKAKKDQAAMMEKLMYTAPDSLKNHISSNMYEELVAYFARYNTPIQAIDQLKPGAVAMTITMLKLSELGYDPEFGIDKYFLEKAQSGKKVVELESMDQQLNLINGLGEDFLKYTLQENEKSKDEFEKIIKAWKTGNPDEIEALLQQTLKENPDMQTFMDKFIFERNTKMAANLEKALRRKGTYFTVVGAAHLVGDKGILNLLKKKGYTIEQL